MRTTWLAILLLVLVSPLAQAEDDNAPQLLHDVLPLLKTRCVKCHGPAKREGELNLSTPGTLARGGENGAAIAPGKLDASLLWQRVASDEMPPDEPLEAAEKAILKRWITSGAPGLPEAGSGHPSGDHWAFVPLAKVAPPLVDDPRVANDVDRFLLTELKRHGLTFNPEADRATLIRRVAFDLLGLPPTLEEVAAFQSDESPEAYTRMVDRYLASPHYGERWGKFWLDAAGYADSNGYFNADSDRPLAYRYRDYVVRSFNEDKPWDRFVQEQIAGDELAGFKPGEATTPEVISLLEATHYLRNGQDGTGESDGNPEEVRTDRYAALDSCLQIVSSSLLGLTVQCAKCHDHKFEPLSQRDYYQWQSVFYPAFNIEDWAKPNDRVVQATLPGEQEAWQSREDQLNAKVAALRDEYAGWVREHRPVGRELFRHEFVGSGQPLAEAWSATAPGDDAPGGSPAVEVDAEAPHGALAKSGALHVLETGSGGDRWLSTRQSFDWSPEQEGAWIQVTFDLVDNKTDPNGTAAQRIGFFVGTHDFDDNGTVAGGNVLIDGDPSGGAQVHVDYPGGDSEPGGTLGNARYEPGHNFGVRITRLAADKCLIEHLYDGVPDETTLTLRADQLPAGGFGFEYCCGRSFVVDNVLVEQGNEDRTKEYQQLRESLDARREQLKSAIKAVDNERGPQPGRIASMQDRSASSPEVHLLERGNHTTPGEQVSPAPLSALAEPKEVFKIGSLSGGLQSTGRRLGWARWVTHTDSRPAALLARVQMNRIWQQHFGTGIVATLENLGVSGAAPSHPELLEYLAGEFVARGWSVKAMHRLLMHSAAYRQSSEQQPAAAKIDPENRLQWRMTVRRLDAEALRDAVLATSGGLNRTLGGPYVPTKRDDAGEVLVAVEGEPANRRSIYLQQRRTQTLSLLGVFDSPTIVFNCIQRPVSTIPLQSLSLLNSPFQREQARLFATRVAKEVGEDSGARIKRSFLLTVSRMPTEVEHAASGAFIDSQVELYEGNENALEAAWIDYCQMLLASSSFLYVE
jgi:hypothetical protein